jgi:hypothetical protein
MRKRAAEQVTSRAQAAAEGARTARELAERELAELRTTLAAAQDQRDRAAERLANPGPAPMSPWTGLIDGVRRLAFGEKLTGDAYAVTVFVIQSLAEQTGVAKTLRADGAQAARREDGERQAALIMPPRGHALRPADAGQIFMPLAPPVVGGR